MSVECNISSTEPICTCCFKRRSNELKYITASSPTFFKSKPNYVNKWSKKTRETSTSLKMSAISCNGVLPNFLYVCMNTYLHFQKLIKFYLSFIYHLCIHTKLISHWLGRPWLSLEWWPFTKPVYSNICMLDVCMYVVRLAKVLCVFIDKLIST